MESPRRWNEIAYILGGWFKVIIPGPLERYSPTSANEDWTEMTRIYWKEERERRAAVDELMICAAREMKPPENISPKDAHYALLRLQCALDFLGTAWPEESAESPFGELRASWSDSKAIRWLLIDLWRQRYDHWLKLNAIGKYGPFSFYGIEPPPVDVPFWLR